MWSTRGHYVSREGPSAYIEGKLQFHDINQVTQSRKMLMSKRHTDGLEAPRNSLELTTETSKCYHIGHENIPFSLQVEQHPVKQKFCHPAGVTMKKLIDKEISSNTTRHCAPSVVARLMGMDALSSEGKHMIQSNDHRNKNLRNHLPGEDIAEEASTCSKQVGVMSFKQKKQQLFAFGIKQDNNVSSRSPRLAKPQRREHPQEELLQKFKKEFEAWQSTRVWELSRAIGLGDNHLKERNNQTPALENFEKQKRHLFANTERSPSQRGSSGHLASSAATLGTQRCSIQHEGYTRKEDLPRLRENIKSRNRTKFRDSVQYPELKFNKKQDRSSSPTRIVILKPSMERTEDIEESWPCSSGILDREGSIEHFLEEVRERLRLEIQGKAKNEIRTSICSDEIPFSEKLSDPKQIAQHIAKQIRESVKRDLGTTLIRSESTRSYRSESQPSGPDSPEFIDRNTRKFLGERLRNILRNEADAGFDTVSNGKIRPSIDNERITLRQLADSPTLEKSNYPEDVTGITEMTTMSFREEQVDSVGCRSAGDLSPRNLVRSLSAPVSGTAFGKLLLEDQSLLTGVPVRSKHESTENASLEVRKMRKDVFNFKGKVSNLRHNFTLRHNLFGRKMHSADESGEKRLDSMNCVATSPSIVLNFGVAQENSTEVPPSPASVSSSSFDDLCKPSHPSPVSPLEMPFTEDNTSLEVSGEICSTLPEEPDHAETAETARTLEEIPNMEGTPTMEETYNAAADMKCSGPEEAYLRDILTTAGLYDKPLDKKIFTPWDADTNPVAESVFEEVEEAYAKCTKVDDDDDDDNICTSQLAATCRKILFDMLNEELLHLLSSPISSSTLERCPGGTWVLQGKKLLEDVWRQVETHLHPRLGGTCSLESLVAYDLKTTSWYAKLQEDVDVVGGELEGMILLELVEEFVSDVWC